jgi:DNA polymerase/3'-5' exonuclease PolX
MTNFKDIIITELSVLAQKETIDKNVFKARAYNNVIKQVKTIEKIECMKDLQNIKGIGEQIKKKLEEIFETGKLRSAEKARSTGNLKLYENLMKIHGVGVNKAKELVDLGIESMEDLLEKLEEDPDILNSQQKIGVKYYHDINTRIPRKEMEKHDLYLNKIIKAIDPDILISIVGSYRRKVKESGDIDMLVSFNRKSSKEERAELLSKVIKVLRKEKYIQDTLALGDKKYMGVVKLKRHRVNRRLDILVTSIEEYPFALLYFTGSQALNIILRQVAIDHGLRLNEYTLTKNKKEIKLKTEEEIFNYLGYKYIEPENRTNQKEIDKHFLKSE